MALLDKRILVTGVCSSIGEAIARTLVRRGASVVGLSQSKSELKRISAQIGAGFEPITADIRSSDVILQLARLGKFDALVCHADLGRDAKVGGSVLPDLMQQQLFSALHTIEGCGPAMRDAGQGHVLIIENVPEADLEGVAKASYQTWKGGYDALVKKWTAELGPAGVRVTVIGLGEMPQPDTDRTGSRELLSEQVANAVVNTLEANNRASALVEIAERSEQVAPAA